MSDLYTRKNESTEPPPTGALSGRRFVIQPNLSVRTWPCNAGSRALADYEALANATVITRLSQAGAVLSGSARMAELGFGLAGDTTAQLIADGHNDLGIVTDTMGEARMAAAGVGLFGFKPSYGRVSRCGLIGLVPSMECHGILARHPEQIATALSAMAGPDIGDPSMPDDCACGFDADLPPWSTPFTAAVVGDCMEALTEPERRAFHTGIDQLEKAGFTVKEIRFADYPLFSDTHHAIAAVEASSSAGKYDGVRYGHRSAAGKNWNEMYLNTRSESFGPLIKPFLFQGAYFQFENFAAFENACRLRGRLVRAINDLLGHTDLLVMPTRRPAHDAARAASLAETYTAFKHTLPANVTGQPALQVPGLAMNGQTDIGLQLLGRRLDDARVLSAGVRLLSLVQEGN
jgi:aspartyl-tRNA(Asn)/glutamyl-tRNA(Gln) amidotransferase subunit A